MLLRRCQTEKRRAFLPSPPTMETPSLRESRASLRERPHGLTQQLIATGYLLSRRDERQASTGTLHKYRGDRPPAASCPGSNPRIVWLIWTNSGQTSAKLERVPPRLHHVPRHLPPQPDRVRRVVLRQP